MDVTFWGTRGSIAKAGPTTVRYGGNTSCVEVRSDSGTLVVLDCGTGAHGLGIDLMERSLGEPVDGHLLISHTHWDHIQGLPFFAPLLTAGGEWHVYGPRGLAGSIGETLAGQMQYSYFPVTVEQLAASVDYHDLVEGTFHVGDITVHTLYLNHPALTLAYRLEVDGASVVYAPDHEPHERRLADGGDIASSRHDLAHARFFEGADLLIHDSQYLAEEYPAKAGWGHSTVEYVVEVARVADVGMVALFHHDPTRTDAMVDDVLVRVRDLAAARGWGGEIIAATEGDTISLSGEAERSPARNATVGPETAIGEVGQSVLLAVSTPEIAAILREAGEAENLQIWEATDRDQALVIARAERPAIVVLEEIHDGEVLVDFARAIGEIGPRPGGEISLIAITTTGGWPPGAEDIEITDSLVWPASAGYIRTKLRAWLLRRACRWQAAPRPADEVKRLESLRALKMLDTEPEPRFDRLTALTSRTLDVPIALISLIDEDRQWFKSHHGIDATEAPRDMAICAHAILGPDPLQVTDALQDDRFADNPMVANSPHLRFYAGAPLVLADGTRAGTLCVLDHRPRALDPGQLAELTRLAALVCAELEAPDPD